MLGTHAPTSSEEIDNFWRKLFDVVKGVREIHELPADKHVFHAVHADIKPANILLVKGKYKISDPGYARFKRETSNNDVEDGIRLTGYTKTFGRYTLVNHDQYYLNLIILQGLLRHANAKRTRKSSFQNLLTSGLWAVCSP
jgi:serine/threonine protein kinase